MQEDGRLCHLRLLQVVVGTGKHDVGDAITKNVVSFLKEFLSQWVVVVQILTHSYKLCSLSGKNKCFHFLLTFILN